MSKLTEQEQQSALTFADDTLQVMIGQFSASQNKVIMQKLATDLKSHYENEVLTNQNGLNSALEDYQNFVGVPFDNGSTTSN